MTTLKSEEKDIAFNKSLITLAEKERNLRSWLSTSLKAQNGTISAQKQEDTEPDEEGDVEDGGLGYVAPATSLLHDRQSVSANDKLRTQLLGNRAGSRSAGFKGQAPGPKVDGLSASKPRPLSKRANVIDSDDEVDGRTSTTTKKPAKHISTTLTPSTEEKPRGNASSINKGSNKRKASYLDEVLAKRQKKKGK